MKAPIHRRAARLRRALSLLLVPLALALVGEITALPPTAHAAAAASTPDVTTRHATANIAFTLGPERARADIRTMARRADVIGWQEITNGYQAKAIQRLANFETWWPGGRRSDGRVAMNPRNSNPISYRSDIWRRIDQGARLTMTELKGVCRDRYVSWVVLKHRRTGRRVARWNIHFVPGAWQERRFAGRARRQELWLQQSRIVRRTHASLVARGLPVIGGGDINRRHYPFVGDKVVYDTLSAGRIDNLVRAKMRRIGVAGSMRWVPLNSDHDGLVLPYVLRSGDSVPTPTPTPQPEPEDDKDWDDHPGNGNGKGLGKWK